MQQFRGRRIRLAMNSKPNHSPFEFEMSDIDRLEILKNRPRFGRDLVRSLGVRGLHCGCGLNLFPGWLNTDQYRLNDGDGNESRAKRIACVNGSLFYLEHDATVPFPIASGTFDWVYSEHFLEHLEPTAAISWLKDARRMLKPGGLLRLTTPDLAGYVEGYMDRRSRFFAGHRKRVLHLFPNGAPSRRAWMINQIFYFWEHRWVYDFDEVVHAATRAGFVPGSFTRCSFRQGQVPEVCALDWDFRNDETLYVEMVKTPFPKRS